VNNTNNLDNFFSFVSKAVIIIPIFILIISLFFKFSSPKNSASSLNQVTPTIIPIKNNSFKFNLKGPIVCNSLFIQNKKVLFKDKLINYLLNGDCLYIWETGKTNGEKKCSLLNYVNMAESYLGFLNINDLVDNNLVKDFIKDKNINVDDVINSCKKKEIKYNSIFNVPKNILFKLK